MIVEYSKGSDNLKIEDYDIELEGYSTIRIKKLKTDDYRSLYQSISKLELPVSVMDIRKVENVIRGIKTCNEGIKVSISENVDELENNQKILAIGPKEIIKYHYKRPKDLMSNYFKVLNEKDTAVLEVINDYNIAKNQYFPIFGFSSLERVKIEKEVVDDLKTKQKNMIKKLDSKLKYELEEITIDCIFKCNEIAKSYKENCIVSYILRGELNLDDLEEYLIKYPKKEETNYRKLLCVYDYKKYSKKASF